MTDTPSSAYNIFQMLQRDLMNLQSVWARCEEAEAMPLR